MSDEPRDKVLPVPVVIDGRPGTIVYLAADGSVVADPEHAVRARVVFDDGGSAFFYVNEGEGAEP